MMHDSFMKIKLLALSMTLTLPRIERAVFLRDNCTLGSGSCP